jgi:hypothetical protein
MDVGDDRISALSGAAEALNEGNDAVRRNARGAADPDDFELTGLQQFVNRTTTKTETPSGFVDRDQ